MVYIFCLFFRSRHIYYTHVRIREKKHKPYFALPCPAHAIALEHAKWMQPAPLQTAPSPRFKQTPCRSMAMQSKGSDENKNPILPHICITYPPFPSGSGESSTRKRISSRKPSMNSCTSPPIPTCSSRSHFSISAKMPAAFMTYFLSLSCAFLRF